MPKRAELLIYDDIGDAFGGLTAKAFTADLRKLGKVDTINLRINSMGGSVFEGTTIYNALKRHPARVEVDVDGLAASIASLIAMAGDTVRIAENGFMMIHRAWGMVGGNAGELRAVADRLEKVDDVLAATYQDRTGLDAERVADMLEAETWLDAGEAVELGFADELSGQVDIAAHALASRVAVQYEHLPDALRWTPKRPGSKQWLRHMENTIGQLGLTPRL